MMVSALPIDDFDGKLVLFQQQALLLQSDDNGVPKPPGILMLFDPQETGVYDDASVDAAFRILSQIPNAADQPAITVRGFTQWGPGGLPLLFITGAPAARGPAVCFCADRHSSDGSGPCPVCGQPVICI
jgi:hypothetical protein